MSGAGFHVHGPYEHEMEHQAQHGDNCAAKMAVTTAILATLGALFSEKYKSEAKRYGDEKKDIQTKAEALEKAGMEANARADASMHVHHRWAQAMTLIQVAIALAAIALLTRKRWLQWGVYLTGAGSLVLAALALAHV